MKDYKKKFTAKTICASFKELQQNLLETIRDYSAKVSSMLPQSLHLTKEAHEDLTQAEMTRVKQGIKFGMNTSKMFIQTQMFIPDHLEKL